ncbi:hypothetical protein [Mesorhizobium sp.]|uniref:hypothetical protein n=1 Tax=Mesorhizobium sp. TaxID=1871066 RepID=UPI00338E36DD
MLVAITLANKMACGIWAMLTKQEGYRIRRGACAICNNAPETGTWGCEEGMNCMGQMTDQIGSGNQSQVESPRKLALLIWT